LRATKRDAAHGPQKLLCVNPDDRPLWLKREVRAYATTEHNNWRPILRGVRAIENADKGLIIPFFTLRVSEQRYEMILQAMRAVAAVPQDSNCRSLRRGSLRLPGRVRGHAVSGAEALIIVSEFNRDAEILAALAIDCRV
jgi:hypothetical protein